MKTEENVCGHFTYVHQTRIKSSLPTLIEKEYYPVAQRELRSLVGYLRFDLEFLATLTADKKAAAATVNTATTAVCTLDA